MPIWLHLKFTLEAEIGYTLEATATMSTGVRQDVDVTFGVDYEKSRSPRLRWNPSVTDYPLEIVPFTYNINGTATAYATLIPQIDLRVYSLAGVYANVDPTVEITGSATINNGQLTSANWSLVADANLNIGMSLLGSENEDLPALEPFKLFHKPWSSVFPPPSTLTIIDHPRSQQVLVGSSATFAVNATGPALTYQWYHNNGTILPGKTDASLTLYNVNLGHLGAYRVKVTSGGQTQWSDSANLTVYTVSTPSGMALIPAGSFTMGDNFNDTDISWGERPTHTVYVSAFYMDRYEVTKALWDEVYQWAINRPAEVRYSFEYGAQGKANNHPAHTMTWYDAVKWCNARSEKEGRTPAYYTSAAQTTVYRSGQVNVQNDWVKWSAGYRLPTEAEWEKAARGGSSGQRFPWGNTITHSQANYYSSSSYAYDTSSTRNYHPTYSTGGTPYTSPVGSFAPTGYGLYDMAGNVWEWCWDWWSSSYYGSSPSSDPRGPTSGTYRGLRGGSWRTYAITARCAGRSSSGPFYLFNNFGFRCVVAGGSDP